MTVESLWQQAKVYDGKIQTHDLTPGIPVGILTTEALGAPLTSEMLNVRHERAKEQRRAARKRRKRLAQRARRRAKLANSNVVA